MQYISSGPLSPKDDYLSSPVDSLPGGGFGGPLYGHDTSIGQVPNVGKQTSDFASSAQDGSSSAYGFNPSGPGAGYGNYSIQQTFNLGEATSSDPSHGSNVGLNVSYHPNETGSPRIGPNATVGQPLMSNAPGAPAQTPMRQTQGWMSSPAPSTVHRDVLAGVDVPGYSPAHPPSMSMTPFGGYPTGLSAHPGMRRPDLPPSYGSSPTLRSARRARQVTQSSSGSGSGGAGTVSVPPSPLSGKRDRTTSGETDSLGSRPLERAVSGPTTFSSTSGSRDVSGWYAGGSRTASGMSTFSTGSEIIMSPHLEAQSLGPYSGTGPIHPSLDAFRYPMREGGPMLDGTGQMAPSLPMQAYLSQMGAVPCGPNLGLTTTPDLIPGNFTVNPMGAVTPTMGQHMFIPPNQTDASSYMQQTPVFPQGGFPSHARTQTLDTIAESDLTELETPPVDYSAIIPPQAILPSQPTFQSMAYPAVPGMMCPSPSAQPAQPAQWIPNYMPAGVSPLMPPQGPMRSTSYSMAPAAGMGGPLPLGMHHRSVSETAPRSNPTAPGALSAIVVPPSATAPMPPYDPQTWNHSPGMEPFSGGRAKPKPEPITPTRKRAIYPPVGQRLRPGPKPKPKTPKKGKVTPRSEATASGGIAADQSAQTIPPMPQPVFETNTAPTSVLATPNLPSSSATSESVAMTQSSSAPLPTFSTDGLTNPSANGLSPSFYPVNQGSPTEMLSTVDPQLVAQQQQQQQEGIITFKLERQAPPVDRHHPSFSKEFIESQFAGYLELNEKGDPIRRFRCLIAGCDRTFPRKSAIKAHVQTHVGDKPYQCPSCDHAFVRQHDLKRHMTTHEGEKTHKCTCKQEFARSDALARHVQREICPPLRAIRELRLAEESARRQGIPPLAAAIRPAGGMPQPQVPLINMPMGKNGLGVIFPQAGVSGSSQMPSRPPQ